MSDSGTGLVTYRPKEAFYTGKVYSEGDLKKVEVVSSGMEFSRRPGFGTGSPVR
jgi:hypothetical protein